MGEAMWIDILLAISVAACGGLCGWVSHALGSPLMQSEGLAERGNEASAAEGFGGDDASVATPEVDDAPLLASIAATLQNHAQTMSDNVDIHQQKVGSINEQLMVADEANPKLIAKMVRQVIQANEALQGQLVVAQEQVQLQTLALVTAEERAKTDALTKIPNRRALNEYLAERHAVGPKTSEDSPHAGVLVLMDVDHFKKFNDEHGHLAGDEVLRVVAGLMHHELNKFGIVARFGGEEFAAILDDYDLETAGPIIETVRKKIGQRVVEFEGKSLQVTASMGMAVLGESDSTERWIELADEGLYASKSAGRDCLHIGSSEGQTRFGGEQAVKTPRSTEAIDEPAEEDSSSSDNFDDENDPSPLSYLPDRQAIEGIFDQLRAKSSDLELSLMILRCPFTTPSDQLKSLLPVVRSNLRNVDELGYLDNQTLMILLPSVQQSAAKSRGDELVQASADIGLTGEAAPKLGVANLEPGESFDELLESVLAQVT